MLFTCPSRYSFTIGYTGVFSLGGWSPQLHARTLVPGVTQDSTTGNPSSLPTGLSPSLAPRSKGLRLTSSPAPVGPTTPRPQGPWFRLGPVRSPLLRPSQLISLPRGTEMFQFPRFAPFENGDGLHARRVAPFGHLGLIACVPLPQAYRSLPRPSSPPCTQASPAYILSLDQISDSNKHNL